MFVTYSGCTMRALTKLYAYDYILHQLGPHKHLRRRHRAMVGNPGSITQTHSVVTGCSTVVLMCFTCPATTVVTVILWALDRVRNAVSTSQKVLSVYRFIGVLQQESGKGPRIANGAAYCVPDLTSHTPHPWRALLGRPDPFGSRLPHLSAGKSGVGGERVV